MTRRQKKLGGSASHSDPPFTQPTHFWAWYAWDRVTLRRVAPDSSSLHTDGNQTSSRRSGSLPLPRQAGFDFREQNGQLVCHRAIGIVNP